jgi:Pyridine nucleotide-disulphide oxidoreductase
VKRSSNNHTLKAMLTIGSMITKKGWDARNGPTCSAACSRNKAATLPTARAASTQAQRRHQPRRRVQVVLHRPGQHLPHGGVLGIQPPGGGRLPGDGCHPRRGLLGDPQASQVVAEVFGAEGISVHTGVPAARVQHHGQQMVVTLGSGEEITAGRLVVATGRHPVTAHLGLQTAGVRLDERGHIVTDRHLATTVRGIYAAGEVTGRMAFTHAAFAMGRLAVRNALRPRWSQPDTFKTAVLGATIVAARAG